MESWSKYKITMKYVVNPPFVVLNVINREQAFLITSVKSNFVGSSVLLSNNFPLVELAHSYFEMMWFSTIDYSLKKQYELKEIIE
jgi:hypothetical protein